jgi:hypothetical protein
MLGPKSRECLVSAANVDRLVGPTMECPFCEGPIDGSNVDVGLHVAKCSTCDALFSFGELIVDRQGIGVFAGAYEEKLPRGVWIDDQQTAGRITDTWLSAEYVFIAVVAAFADVVIASVLVRAVSSGWRPSPDAPWTAYLVGAVMLVTPLVLTYLAVAGLFNSTVVDVADGYVRVQHGPLPWFGNRQVPAADIAEIFFDETRVLRKGSRHPIITYNVNAGTRRGETFRLLIDLPSLTPALLCQLHLDKWLKLRDWGHDKEAAQQSEAIMVRDESYREKPHDA